MDKSEFKKNLYSICYARQNEMIAHLKELIADSQQMANEYGQPKDRYDSYRMQLLRKRDMYAQQLEKAMAELDILKKIDTERISKVVEFGAVVHTKDQKLFISISLGKLDCEGETYYAVSVKVPFFDVIKGKKKGSEFVFNGKASQITEVF